GRSSSATRRRCAATTRCRQSLISRRCCRRRKRSRQTLVTRVPIPVIMSVLHVVHPAESIFMKRTLLITFAVAFPTTAVAQQKAITPEQLEFFEKKVRPVLVQH